MTTPAVTMRLCGDDLAEGKSERPARPGGTGDGSGGRHTLAALQIAMMPD